MGVKSGGARIETEMRDAFLCVSSLFLGIFYFIYIYIYIYI